MNQALLQLSSSAVNDDDLKIVRRKPLYRGHFRLDLYRFRHRLHAGGWSKIIGREIFDRGNAVALLLYDPDRDTVVLVEQFRLPAMLGGAPAWQIEPVAGLLDQEGESEEAVARREAQEEAGLTITGELIPDRAGRALLRAGRFAARRRRPRPRR